VTTQAAPAASSPDNLDQGFRRGLGVFDSTMIVAGSMIGSGIFLVSAEMARLVDGAGWLLACWLASGVLTVVAALAYGELAAMMPKAGGQYVYLREAFSPLIGFLYGWTLFMVIQTGTIAAVSVGFARHLGVFLPRLSEGAYLIPPLHFMPGYAISLSAVQLVAILLIVVLTWANTRGLEYGRVIQNGFTTTKVAALLGLIAIALALGWNAEAISGNLDTAWRAPVRAEPGLVPGSLAALFVTLCIAQVGSLFACEAWNNITFTAGEVREPRRTIPLSLAIGAGGVVLLYVAANVAYLVTLPIETIQTAPADRVGATTLEAIFPGLGALLLAGAIMISTSGACNGIILTGARAYYAMARDRLFFPFAGQLNAAKVPGRGLWLQGLWASVLVLPRTYDATSGLYGNLYSNLLDYVVSATLLFYILTIAGLFRLRVTRPDAPRPYRAFGYPLLPAAYIAAASTILTVLFVYRPSTTWPGFAIVGIGVVAYAVFRAVAGRSRDQANLDVS
jgi:basic amino acid/polyamine antiporter, APA family